MSIRLRNILFYGFGLLLLQFGLKAQPRKGSFLVSPSFGLTGKKIETKRDESGSFLNSQDIDSKKDELLSVGFFPRVGYLFTNRISAGLSIKYGRKILNEDDTKLRMLTTGPFCRYYLLVRKIAPYLEVEGGAGRYTELIFPETGSSTLAKKSSVYYVAGAGGMEIFLIPGFSFDLGINYKRTFEDYSLPSDLGNIRMGNIGIRAGLSLYISPKEMIRKGKKSGKSWI